MDKTLTFGADGVVMLCSCSHVLRQFLPISARRPRVHKRLAGSPITLSHHHGIAQAIDTRIFMPPESSPG